MALLTQPPASTICGTTTSLASTSSRRFSTAYVLVDRSCLTLLELFLLTSGLGLLRVVVRPQANFYTERAVGIIANHSAQTPGTPLWLHMVRLTIANRPAPELVPDSVQEN